MTSSVASEYARRLAERRRRSADLDRTHFWLSNVRLVLAAAGALLVWLAFGRAALSPWWALVPWALFAVVAVVHAKVLERIERARRAEQLYERGLERLAGRWAGTGRGGDAFGADHPYARDLDLFGRASLFELLNTARSEAGESTLAGWLKGAAEVDEVAARQAAIAELRAMIDLREALAILAADGEVSRTGALARWAAGSAQPHNARNARTQISPWVPRLPWRLLDRAWPMAFAACAAVTVLATVLAWFAVLSWAYLVAWLAVEGIVAWTWKRSLLTIIEEVGKPAADLKILAALAACIDRQPFRSPRLVSAQAALKGCTTDDTGSGGAGRQACPIPIPAAKAIARLERLVSLLESSTHNLFAMPITRALLVPEQLAMAIERWRARYGRAIDDWLRSIGDVEALCAIATYAYENPDDPFPAVTAGPARFDAEALSHPLLNAAAAVRNDVALGGGGPHVLVVSGSNMSGKSTLLRAVGVNVVLALAGAPVRARRLTMSRLALGATIRVDDSLEQGHSRFYNEILRLRAIVDAARGPAPLLFLLDEILHGTNSYDRRIGAEAVVRALVEAGAIGVVTTHDLALAELPARLGAPAANAHFEDRLENGRMVFDYRMRPGVVEHSNALALMRAIGLDV